MATNDPETPGTPHAQPGRRRKGGGIGREPVSERRAQGVAAVDCHHNHDAGAGLLHHGIRALAENAKEAVAAASAAGQTRRIRRPPRPRRVIPPKQNRGNTGEKQRQARQRPQEVEETDAALKNAGVKVTSDGKTTVPLNKILVNIPGRWVHGT
jgi:hypothetical protein